MAPEWPFLRKFDDEITQNLVKKGEDVASISQHIIDIHQLIAIETYSDPYLASYNHQKSQIEPFSAKMGPEWPFLRKFDDENTQNLVKTGQDVEISLQHNNFMPSKKLCT